MNKRRRLMISRAIAGMAASKSILEDAMGEEQDSLDNMPENLQYSDRYEVMERTVDLLGETIEALDNAIDLAEEAKYAE